MWPKFSLHSHAKTHAFIIQIYEQFFNALFLDSKKIQIPTAEVRLPGKLYRPTSVDITTGDRYFPENFQHDPFRHDWETAVDHLLLQNLDSRQNYLNFHQNYLMVEAEENLLDQCPDLCGEEPGVFRQKMALVVAADALLILLVIQVVEE